MSTVFILLSDSERVAQFLKEIAVLHKGKIAYVNETSIDSYLQREYCYDEKGRKFVDFVSGKKYRRVSIAAAKLGNTYVV